MNQQTYCHTNQVREDVNKCALRGSLLEKCHGIHFLKYPYIICCLYTSPSVFPDAFPDTHMFCSWLPWYSRYWTEQRGTDVRSHLGSAKEAILSSSLVYPLLPATSVVGFGIKAVASFWSWLRCLINLQATLVNFLRLRDPYHSSRLNPRIPCIII